MHEAAVVPEDHITRRPAVLVNPSVLFDGKMDQIGEQPIRFVRGQTRNPVRMATHRQTRRTGFRVMLHERSQRGRLHIQPIADVLTAFGLGFFAEQPLAMGQGMIRGQRSEPSLCGVIECGPSGAQIGEGRVPL